MKIICILLKYTLLAAI